MRRPYLRRQPHVRVPTPEALERRRAETARLAQGRRSAARLDAAEPAWHVMYRAGARELMAMAMWDPGFPLILTDTDPHALLTQMRAAEQHAGQARAGLDALAALAHQPRGGAGLPESPYSGPRPDRTDQNEWGL
jgi:hypothetical protein